MNQAAGGNDAGWLSGAAMESSPIDALMIESKPECRGALCV